MFKRVVYLYNVKFTLIVKFVHVLTIGITLKSKREIKKDRPKAVANDYS